ncbi:MAG TPA: ATP-binding protein [Flavobacteriales bacterium]|jgi:nicotinamide riboside kinase|nr:ATP-binding protein [Flavobacteriales bacterium]HJN64556.1 ATP-binding protein [Flavobacteriales bacterium]|tara:strand:- start:75 stop:566 length:492 start_codon:yes stop_codon:yes gene_type:complete
MLKIIVTGPESSGKTTLCKALSEHFKIPSTEEYAREYLNNLGREYKEEDLIEIAKGQLQSETNSQLLDTDLITIKIWSEYKYGKSDKWILEQIEKQKSENRYYLLCRPDIPWEADPLRESPLNRDELFKIYKREIEELGHDYLIIEGKNRFKNSISKIASLIS